MDAPDPSRKEARFGEMIKHEAAADGDHNLHFSQLENPLLAPFLWVELEVGLRSCLCLITTLLSCRVPPS